MLYGVGNASYYLIQTAIINQLIASLFYDAYLFSVLKDV